MQTRVTEQSQPYRLRQRLEEAQVGHGQEIRADLPGIRIMASRGAFDDLRHWLRPDTARTPQGDLFFCAMGRIQVREIVHPSDRRPLPDGVVVDGLEVPESGTYDILNALVQSNGRIRVVVDPETRVVPAASTPAAVYSAG
jgi:hypothetical protein